MTYEEWGKQVPWKPDGQAERDLNQMYVDWDKDRTIIHSEAIDKMRDAAITELDKMYPAMLPSVISAFRIIARRLKEEV